METITLKQAKKIDFNNLSVVLGTFDGLHLGHKALINAAKKHNGSTIAFTFDALPIDLFKSRHKPMQLFTLQEKIKAFEETSIDYLCITHFDDELANMDKYDFEKLLVEAFSPVNVIAGYNYTYGRHAEGTANILLKDSALLGFNVEVIPKVLISGIPVSSTKIREFLWSGNIEKANSLLGYSFSMSGKVVLGKNIGKSLGFPTANICIAKEKIVPKSGVYSVLVRVGNESYCGVCNIGVNPTVIKDANQSIEAHIIDFDREIYDENIILTFNNHIRDEICFESKEQLSKQIKKDIKTAANSF